VINEAAMSATARPRAAWTRNGLPSCRVDTLSASLGAGT
jgi:hypothetical protein